MRQNRELYYFVEVQTKEFVPSKIGGEDNEFSAYRLKRTYLPANDLKDAEKTRDGINKIQHREARIVIRAHMHYGMGAIWVPIDELEHLSENFAQMSDQVRHDRDKLFTPKPFPIRGVPDGDAAE